MKNYSVSREKEPKREVVENYFRKALSKCFTKQAPNSNGSTGKDKRMTDKVLIVFFSRETGKYKRFEVYDYDGKLITKENVLERVRAWNSNAKLDTNAKIYNDTLLCEMAIDARNSCSRNTLINSLRAITRNIENSIEELNGWSDDIKSEIKNSGEDD